MTDHVPLDASRTGRTECVAHFRWLTLHGMTQPVVLDATYNGGYIGHPMDPHARIGFSAHGTLKRSDFGIAFGIPQPGSSMGVGDTVEFSIEAEFSGPAWAGAGNTPAAGGP